MASHIQTLPADASAASRTEKPLPDVEQLEVETAARYRLQRLEAEVMAPARRLTEPAARLRWIVAGYVSLAIDEPGIMRLFADGRARLSAGLRERRDGYLRDLENDLAEVSSNRAGIPAIDPTVAAVSLLGLVEWGVCSFRAGGSLGREEAVAQLSHLALHGLVHRTARDQPSTPPYPGGPGHRALAA